VGDGSERFGGFAREVRHDAHDEGELDFFLRAVQFDIIFDLHPRRPIPVDELLAAGLCHRFYLSNRGTLSYFHLRTSSVKPTVQGVIQDALAFRILRPAVNTHFGGRPAKSAYAGGSPVIR